MPTLLQKYLDDNKMYSFEGERGIKHMEKIIHEVCGYSRDWGGLLNNFFADNPAACQAVVEWIGSQNNIDWQHNLEDLTGPEAEDDVGDLVPPEEVPVFEALPSPIDIDDARNFVVRGFK